MTDAAHSANQSANRAAKEVTESRPVKTGVRVGIVAYGITHLLVAWLALQIAFGSGDEQANQSGAFEKIARQPFGVTLLWVLVVGFAAVALWRLELTIWGFSYEADRTTRLRRRAGCGVRVAVFAVLAVLAARTAAGGRSGGGGKQGATATVLGMPGGRLVVSAVGIGILVAGVLRIVNGWRKKFADDMALPGDAKTRQLTVRLGQVGSVAKGASLVLIGVLVVAAAISFRPDEASGLDAALRTLAAQPYGVFMLIVVALGLAVYGIFCFFDARYHRV